MPKNTLEKIIYWLITISTILGSMAVFANALGLATTKELETLETETKQAFKDQIEARKTDIKEAIQTHEEKEAEKYKALKDAIDGIKEDNSELKEGIQFLVRRELGKSTSK